MNVINTAKAYFDKKGLDKQEFADKILWHNEFVEYCIESGNYEDWVVRCQSVEMSTQLIFFFHLPENSEQFIELMKILDRT